MAGETVMLTSTMDKVRGCQSIRLSRDWMNALSGCLSSNGDTVVPVDATVVFQ